MRDRAHYLENNHDLSLCCGCRACEQICSKKAIVMVPNFEGFLYPKIDNSQCIHCGACALVCPLMKGEEEKSEPQNVYAAFNSDNVDRKKSSSGGIFSAIAKVVLSKGGAVYGAAFDECLNLKNQRIVTCDDLCKLMGSKYVQSDTGTIYKSVKKDLVNGLWVYFSGTPCQVAGLKLFLRKNYNQLITSDIVCHGTPSQKIFKMFVSVLEKKYHETIIDFKFRDKRVNGWSCTCSCLGKNEKGKIKDHIYDQVMNAYMDAFLSGSLNRECCYKCPFAEKKRVGDFTLADYWGVKKIFPQIDYQDGVSIFTINTKKGKSFLELNPLGLNLTETSYEVAANAGNNLQMLCPSIRHKERNHIYERAFANPKGFISIYYCENELKRKIRFYIKYILRSNRCVYQSLRTLKKLIWK